MLVSFSSLETWGFGARVSASASFGTNRLRCSRRETQREPFGTCFKWLLINAIHHQFSSITATKDVGNDKG